MKAKQILLLFLLLFPFALKAQTNFSTVSYGTGAYSPQEIFFGDSEEVYYVGQCTIRGTTNGEIDWSGYCYTPINLFAGDVPARANCFVVGAKGVIRKNESCDIFGDWHDQTSGTMDSLFSVKFFNIDTGFVVGQNGKVLRTFNNGRNWTILPSGVTQTLRRLIFTSNRTLYAAGDNGVVIKSTDNANSWFTLNTGTTERINDIDFIGNDTGYVVGSNGLMLKTTDAGINWIPVASGVTTKLNGVDFITPDKGFIVGDAGVVRKTTDGGNNWVPFVFSTFNNNVADIKFRDANNGYFAAQQDFYRTRDGGSTWFSMSQELRSVEFPAKDTGYIIGANVMSKTTDGGITWSSTHPFHGVTMYASCFLNSDTGYAGGYFGTIYKTTDGGINWTAQNSHSSALIRAIHFFNANKGIAVGSNYTIERTINGGNTWNRDSLPNTNLYGYNDLFFATSSIGYLCGAVGTIRKTTDGGTSFTVQTSGVTYHLYKIYFLDTLKGFAIGEHGTVLKTVNGGTTWTSISIGVTSNLMAIAFYDSLNGYIGGDGGALFVTKDGGSNWMYKGYYSFNIYDITFFDGYHGFLVGATDFHARYEPLKAADDYFELCSNSGPGFTVQVANNIQIDTGNVFVMEMDTTGNDFSDAFALGAVRSDTSGCNLYPVLPAGVKAGEYAIRLRATKTYPLNTAVPTKVKVFDDPVVTISQSNDTLFTLYHPNYLYQWRKGYISIPGANSNYLVINQPGDYNVYVKYGCCNTGYASVHANQCNGQWINAPAVKPVYYVCDSSSATITASGASHYHWYATDSSTIVISSDSFFVTPPITILDTFYVAAVYGACESDRMPVLVYPVTKPTPPVSENYSQCGNNEIFILPHAGTSFNWYTDSASAPFLTNVYFYHIANPLTDTIYITNSYYDCQSTYVPVIIQIESAPSANNISGDITVVAADSVTYHYPSSPGSTLQWMVTGGTYTVYADSIVVKWGAVGAGLIRVLETNSSGCNGDTVSLAVAINVVSSISDQPDDNIFIFPNPVSDQLNIVVHDSPSLHLKASVYDILGRAVKTVALNNSINAVSLKGLTGGIYYVKVTDVEKVVSGKLIFKED